MFKRRIGLLVVAFALFLTGCSAGVEDENSVISGSSSASETISEITEESKAVSSESGESELTSSQVSSENIGSAPESQNAVNDGGTSQEKTEQVSENTPPPTEQGSVSNAEPPAEQISSPSSEAASSMPPPSSEDESSAKSEDIYSAASSEQGQSISGAKDLERLLSSYSTLNTNLKTLNFRITVTENSQIYYPYDYWIKVKFYSWEIDEIRTSIKYTDEEKSVFFTQLKEHMASIAKTAEAAVPGKKIYGGYYEGFYRYPALQLEWQEYFLYSFVNFDMDYMELFTFYDEAPLSNLRWYFEQECMYIDYPGGENTDSGVDII